MYAYVHKVREGGGNSVALQAQHRGTILHDDTTRVLLE